ncbi:MAG: cation-transporting P-type ATPase [bacterium]
MNPAPVRGTPGKDGIAVPAADASALSRLEPSERLSRLETGLQGLAASEAENRLRQFGPNEPVNLEKAHPVRTFFAQFTHTLALLLWFASGLAFAAGIPALGGAVVAVVVLNGVFAFVQEYRAEQVIDALLRSVAVQARAMRDGVLVVLPASDLVPGDVIHLGAGDIAPADCSVLQSEGLRVDLSMLTGESAPVERAEAAVGSGPGSLHLSEISNVVPAGAGVASGTATALVFATGVSSSVGVVAGLVEGVKARESILERQVGQLSRVTATVAVLSGTATLGLASVFTDTSFVAALTFGTGVIVALVPEGLLPTLSVSLAIGARRMAERGAVVRRLSAVEIVGSVTVICTDKTGTLTENSVTVHGITGLDGSSQPSEELLAAAVLCNDCEERGDGSLSGDPIDRALWAWAGENGTKPAEIVAKNPRITGDAFDARARYMVTVCEVAGVNRTFAKGAPEEVTQLIGSDDMPAPLVKGMEEATSVGDRVILLASGPTKSELAPIGIVRFSDPPRAGVTEAIQACRDAGVRIIMLTGDHPATALSVARAIGLAWDGIPAVTGQEIDQMPDSGLRDILKRDAIVARIDPEQKLRIVRVLQAAGEVVVMTGDGVNDAPALRAADVGVAMGLRGTEVAKNAADIVLADDNFTTIVTGIEEGRSIAANIRRFISYVFTSNVAEMVPFLIFIFLPVPLPLAVIQALAVDVGTDLLPALALGAEPSSRGSMTAPPEPPSRPLLTKRLALRTFLFFGTIEASLGMAGFFGRFLWAGWRPGDSFANFDATTSAAATLTFLCIVGGQVGCLFAQRDGSLRTRLSLWSNRWIAAGLAFELLLALALIYIPGVNGVFEMDAVNPVWLLAVPASATVFLALDQIRRVFFTSGRRPSAKTTLPVV